MPRLLYVLIVAVSLHSVLTGTVSAQPSRFHEDWRWAEFTTESGLPSNHVLAIVETESGTPWVFTKSGIAWYDGFVWRQVPIPASPPFSKPYSFHADSHDKIILVHDSILFVGDTNGFRRLEIPHVLHAVPLSDGRMMLLRDQSGKHQLDTWNGSDLVSVPTPENDSKGPTGLYRTQSKTIWVTTDRCLFAWREGSWKRKFCATSFAHDLPYDPLAENASQAGLGIAFGPLRSSHVWEWGKGTELVRHMKGVRPNGADIAPNGTIVLADNIGCFWIRHDDRWSELRLQRISGRLVVMVRFGKNGDLWLCTIRGLHLFKYSSERWRMLSETVASPRDFVTSINDILLASDSSLWLGTQDGLIVRKPDGTFITIRQILGQNIQPVTGVLEDRKKDIWVCSGSGFKGVFRWDRSTWEKMGAGTQLDRAYIHRMRMDRRGRIWSLGSAGPSSSIDKEGPGAFVYENGTVTRWDLPSNRVYAFEEGTDGSLWFGTMAGLSRWKSGKWRHWTHRELFSAIKVGTLAIDREGQVWFSDGNGVVGVLKQDGAFRRITTEDGLPDEQVWEIKVDDKGRVWCTSQAGLAVFCNGLWTRFDEASGLRNTVLWPVLPVGKEVYIGSNNGLIVLSLAGMEDFAPHLSLDQPLTGDNTALLRWKAFARWAEIPSTRIVTRYRINKQPWSEWSHILEANVQNLSPGEYVYEVQTRPLLGDSSSYETVRSTFMLTIPLTKDPRVMVPTAVVAFILIALVVGFTTHARRLKQKQLREELRREHEHSERLAEVDKIKSRFFANISHEFRTPLTLVLGPIDQALSRSKDEWIREKLAMAHRNAGKLHGLINQLLDFSRVEAGTMKLAVSKGNIVSFVQRVVQSFQSWAEQKKHSLRFEAGQECIEGYFDRDNVEKILNNLISNALKFTPEGGVVLVTLAPIASPFGRGERGVRVSVRDTGIGMAPEHLAHIFERFYRVDESHRTEGTGIGLALAKELVELHHGSISVQSAPGKGTEFTVNLPLAREAFSNDDVVEPRAGETAKRRIDDMSDSAAEEDRRGESEEGELANRTLILIVEDSADVRAYIREYLVPEYSVLEAQDGADGLERARATIPDLVVSDIMMPLMDGYELCRELKQDERTSHIPVILLTARAGTENKIEGLELGADDYLTKPFDAKELLARIRNLIEGRRTLREKFSKTMPLKPGEVAVTSMDDAFLKKAIAVVEKCMGDEHFSVEQFSYEMAFSRAQLHRKLRALTNQSTGEFIRHVRLLRAHDLLMKKAGTVSEVAYQTGFGSLSYFTRCYHEYFGYPPSESREHPPNPS